jgi:hypothetical protein
VAINVGANTNQPGFRGPIRPDGTFTFVPIPESAPTTDSVPTYGDLAPHLEADIPPRVHDRPVHLDPEFADYPFGEAYTYGDEHGVKARPLAALDPGDRVYFYATLSVRGEAAWLPPDWGAFLIGHFELAHPSTTPDGRADLSATERDRFASNAHRKRDPPDARVLLAGDPDASGLYERAVPLSTAAAGTDPGPIVTALSADSGKGPWWRRPLRFDDGAAAALRERVDAADAQNYQG